MLDGYVLRGPIYYPADAADDRDDYRTQWEDEADQDPVYSATGVVSHGRDDYATLTATRQQMWREFPARSFGTILEIGCGYGRVPMILTSERGVTCDRYIGVDISRNMLTRFARYRDEHRVFPGATVQLVCESAERLPLAKDSVDLVISSAVFLHMGKQYVRRTLERIAHALKPDGNVAFDTSFPNAWGIGLLPSRLFGRFAAVKPNRAKYYSRSEIEELMHTTGVAAKCGQFTIEATEFAILPGRIRKVRVPLAKRINQLLTPPPRQLEDFVATMYSVFSRL
jgi:arsenite methyltransferase